MSKAQVVIVVIVWVGVAACWALGGLAFASGRVVDGMFLTSVCPLVLLVVCRAFWEAT